jgi:hypothetical protein
VKEWVFGVSLMIVLGEVGTVLSAAPLSLDYAQVELLGQGRMTQNDNFEAPLTQSLYFDLGKSHEPLRISVDLDTFEEPVFSEAYFNLHYAALELNKLGNVADIKLGRITRPGNFDFTTLDGASLDLKLHDNFTVGGYAGGKRIVENVDFYEANLVAGGFFKLAVRNRFTLSGQYESEMDVDGNYVSRIGVASDAILPAPASPRLYTIVNYETSEQYFESVTGGLQLSPFQKLNLHFGGGLYNISDEGLNEEAILSTFSRGPIGEGFESIEILLFPFFSIFETLSYSLYDYQEDTSLNGVQLESGFSLSKLENKSKLWAAYFYNLSYGGVAYGGNLKGTLFLGNKFSVNTRLGVVAYDKITSEIGESFASKIGLSYFPSDQTELEVTSEYNSNNEIIDELRAGVRFIAKVF